ncbi:hypothetical protein CRU87_01280 [Aliarcobacter trophiarum LMG 25534]|uniref:Membrane protein n=1 Tax=Aliarcobacter trophiarum LMG 25534 TaxID=1032241 RepID=A0AAD0QI55_9BACT|nr:hypothetical protein [Aliarcobacter trophiarum]AXK48175.1 putative membrane protein [Aliarcobacter trophiarum LMG 25534]RXJ93150.1 hypothetical protein CRU87_01280 [Aliarcobacter trophiarum LMG 25534]
MRKSLLFFIALCSFFTANLFAAKNLYLSYTKIPTNIYKNQKFEIKIEAMITTSKFTNINTKFLNYSNIEVLNPNSSWKKISEDKYENRYYFKVKSTNFTLPLFEVNLFNSNELIDQSILESLQIKHSNIGKIDDRYSNIVAENIILKAFKTKQYNNDNALTIIDLDAINSNLSDFKLKNVEEQGLSSIKEWENIENMVYYFVTPIFQKNLIFTYFNTSTNSFKEIKVPLILQNELVSTQTDLNPNDSTFEKYKKIAAIIVFVIFLLIYIWKRWRIVLILTIISLVVAVLYNLPNKKGVIKTNSYIYILPTKNSTIFFKTEKDERVEALEKRENFVKILGVDSDFIGWVKEDSFEEN